MNTKQPILTGLVTGADRSATGPPHKDLPSNKAKCVILNSLTIYIYHIYRGAEHVAESRCCLCGKASFSPQMELLTHKQNGSVTGLAGEGEVEGEEQEGKKEHTATIKGLWKKAFKNLKSSDQKWLVSTSRLVAV